MEKLTLETLPNAVTNLAGEISEIKRLLLEMSLERPKVTDIWLNINELCLYLPDKPAKATVYGWVSACLIPCRKGQKKLRFLKSEIDVWLSKGKIKTISEIKLDADNYLSYKKRA